MNASAVLGLFIGSLGASKLIVLGRRRASLLVQTAAIFGCALTLIRTLPTICLGRFITSFAGGVANIAMGKSIDETMPPRLVGIFGIQTNFLITVGIMFAMFLGAILPQNEADYLDDKNWRIIYAMPGVFAVVQIVIYLTILREEPINYCIANGRDEEALKLIKRVYKCEG